MNKKTVAVTFSVVLAGAWLLSLGSGQAAQLRHKVGRDVVVRLGDDGVLDRLRLPGRHAIAVPCPHVEHARSLLHVDVMRVPADSTVEPDDCTYFTPKQLVTACAKEPPTGRVCVVDKVKALSTPIEHSLDAQVIDVFTTSGGLRCRVFAGHTELLKATASVKVDHRLAMWGKVFVLDGGPALLLDKLDTGRPKPGTDELRWRTSLRWNDAEVARLLVPAETVLHLPCPHLPAATTTVRIELRRFPKVDLRVDGHDVEAELAYTQELRSYGMQGRPPPLPDHGMWFVYERPFKAVFVMKTVSFPLSIAFVGDDGKIVNIEKLNPGDLHRAVAQEDVRYILEMRQGWFEARGIKPGDKVEFPKPDEEI
jgi:uncharacterized protein